MTVTEQVRGLVELGVPALAGLSWQEFEALGASLPECDDAVVVVHPRLVAPSALAPLLRRGERAGFVVVDMGDLDAFAPVPDIDVPDGDLYLVRGVDRGDDLRNLSPDEADPVIRSRGRTPLTISEGLAWLLADPSRLEPNHCFMTTGSRLTRPDGRLDARTPAVWISGGTGRDGARRRGAPKVGWCWAGNRHTWLGHASAASRGC